MAPDARMTWVRFMVARICGRLRRQPDVSQRDMDKPHQPDPLEVVADAIMFIAAWVPGSPTYQNRNPGDLHGSNLQDGQDADGYSVFLTFTRGYNALLQQLMKQFAGENGDGLGPDSTLVDLANAHPSVKTEGGAIIFAACMAEFIAKALGRPLNQRTRLKDIWQPAGGDLSGICEE